VEGGVGNEGWAGEAWPTMLKSEEIMEKKMTDTGHKSVREREPEEKSKRGLNEGGGGNLERRGGGYSPSQMKLKTRSKRKTKKGCLKPRGEMIRLLKGHHTSFRRKKTGGASEGQGGSVKLLSKRGESPQKPQESV